MHALLHTITIYAYVSQPNFLQLRVKHQESGRLLDGRHRRPLNKQTISDVYQRPTIR